MQKKKVWYRCFPVNFAKFLRTSFLQNTSGRLLLYCFCYTNDIYSRASIEEQYSQLTSLTCFWRLKKNMLWCCGLIYWFKLSFKTFYFHNRLYVWRNPMRKYKTVVYQNLSVSKIVKVALPLQNKFILFYFFIKQFPLLLPDKLAWCINDSNGSVPVFNNVLETKNPSWLQVTPMLINKKICKAFRMKIWNSLEYDHFSYSWVQ